MAAMRVVGLPSSILASLVFLLAGGQRLAAVENSTGVEELELKAAYLISFARFMEWTGESEIVVCTSGAAHLNTILKRISEGKLIEGKIISVRPAERPEHVKGCSILYIAPERIGVLRDLERNDPELRVLTVGDSPGFLDSGGAIEFVWAGTKIHFNASVVAIQRRRLRVDSKLLKLALNLRSFSGTRL